MAEIILHDTDLPADVTFTGSVAVDTETMGLKLHRDRLCLVQLSGGDGVCHLVRIHPGAAAPNLCALMADPAVTKIFHFARFDVAMLLTRFGVRTAPIYCTKIASKLGRTNTEAHGLRVLCKDLLGIDISKQMQSSDWGADTLSREQMEYAASDVLYLHRLKAHMEGLLAREGRTELAQACFDFLPDRAALDVAGWAEEDIFAH
ncbi:ribonuclease D [Roseospira marina]|uniref:Ribonuclease D n=1 Tax=Roseospira marina TaxID=140057 RepID=A0A5M6IHA1_9PROT|nr:ribonuclease D [Roseospira marina]KAA5607552.1 ribonuclease D [Roseospira marina]MBB4312260.1 ribonuclease D [Roseospira marina]MBB5085724.1 ribonuclease D [Roseospira marina]